jgi:hypothetical protein
VPLIITEAEISVSPLFLSLITPETVWLCAMAKEEIRIKRKSRVKTFLIRMGLVSVYQDYKVFQTRQEEDIIWQMILTK